MNNFTSQFIDFIYLSFDYQCKTTQTNLIDKLKTPRYYGLNEMLQKIAFCEICV